MAPIQEQEEDEEEAANGEPAPATNLTPPKPSMANPYGGVTAENPYGEGNSSKFIKEVPAELEETHMSKIL